MPGITGRCALLVALAPLCVTALRIPDLHGRRHEVSDINKQAPAREKIAKETDTMDNEVSLSEASIRTDMSVAATKVKRDPKKPWMDNTIIGGARGKHAACIDGKWLFHYYKKTAMWKKKGNSNATLTYSKKRGWEMKVTGLCGKTASKRGRSLVILKSATPSSGRAASYPYWVKWSAWRVRNSKDMFIPSYSLFMAPFTRTIYQRSSVYQNSGFRRDANAMCVRSDKARKVGNRLRLGSTAATIGKLQRLGKYSCNDWAEATGWKGKSKKYYSVTVSTMTEEFLPDLADLDPNLNQLCSKARMIWFLPKSLSGRRVLVPLGSKRYRVDNSRLNSTKTFLAYRCGKDITDKKNLGGVKWGTTIKTIDEDNDWVTVQVAVKCTPVVFGEDGEYW